FDVHIVADHCTDNTVAFARKAGAAVHDRFDGPRDGKGGALRWLLMRILSQSSDKTQTTPYPAPYTAVIIFDADTRVAPDFLRIMDARLAAGDKVVQGQHRISNPEDGMFPKLTYAMFLIDNRFQNQGRTNLGLSAKIMGDSICFDADVLRKLGWGEGLTEDYQLRLRLLMEGICVVYEPAAIGKGEAAQDWAQARAQRARWLTGTRDASRTLAMPLLREALRTRNPAMLDGALQTFLPSFSTMALLCLGALFVQLVVNTIMSVVWQSLVFPAPLVGGWAAVTLLLIIYPLFGLYLEHAPLSAYPAILSAGPYYVFLAHGAGG
ncbi:MAG: glycosyltransferase, partial [Anaerolineae bacterium]|nr:glycosyltransferase [Anaerolineae bacterium]